MAQKEKKKTIHRDSTTGEFTTKRYADQHPKTTETERVRISKKKSR